EIFVVNISESRLKQREELAQEYARQLRTNPEDIVIVSAKIEAELSELPEEEQLIFLDELGLSSSGIERMAASAYYKLQLMSFLTAGEKEVRAWTIKKG